MAEVSTKRGPGRPRNGDTNTAQEDRVGIQLDADTGRKLDRLVSLIGKQAGESLGITIRVTRTDVVRSLIDAKVSELEAAQEVTE